MMNQNGDVDEVPSHLVHGFQTEDEYRKLLKLDPETRTVDPKEIRASTGERKMQWIQAAEKEHDENFRNQNVYTPATPEEIRRHGPALPMKLVYTLKKGVCKVRAVVCGNFEVNATSQVWTAQAEVASLVSAVRLGALRDWKIGSVDVSGAFMYALLPQHMLVVVQPPKFFVEIGIAKEGELWTLHKAVYGLKVAPRAWGIERDDKLRNLSWTHGGTTYMLKQCRTDTQVWKIVAIG